MIIVAKIYVASCQYMCISTYVCVYSQCCGIVQQSCRYFNILRSLICLPSQTKGLRALSTVRSESLKELDTKTLDAVAIVSNSALYDK